MSKSRVIIAAAAVLICGVSVGIVAAGFMNPAGAQDELEGRRALLQKQELVPEGARSAAPFAGGILGIAANQSYLYVVAGGTIHQYDAESLELVKRSDVAFALTGGPQPVVATPVKKIRLESPHKPVSGKLDRLDEEDKGSGDEADEGGEE